ncbi:MAG: hypothetical protein KGL13_04900 [Gammaproteobacteria bacterium]|nr:hypothetical protein [Gammaproteobacteria bacterium]MDE2345788.1 hypothetical protein [Gammaproteobacteria bacterium]
MTKNLYLAFILLAASLSGCSTVYCGDAHAYAGSAVSPALHAPPGMSVPPTDPNYSIQGVDTAPGKASKQDAVAACLIKPPELVDTQPAAKVKTAEQPTPGQEKAAPGGNKATLKQQVKPSLPAPVAGTSEFPAAAI